MTKPFTNPGPDAAALLGGWKLESYMVGREGVGEETPLGKHPAGLITYTADGAMSAQLAADDAGPSSAMPAYTAYFGAFEVDAGRSLVIHHVHGASEPALVEKALEREYRLDGDRLTLTAWIGEGKHELVWRKIAREDR